MTQKDIKDYPHKKIEFSEALMRPDFPDDEKARKTLFIDRSSSRCGNCGQYAFPDQTKHDIRCGWGVPEGAQGCGVVFEYVGSFYSDMKKHVTKSRPDLKWYSPFNLPSGWE